MSFEKAAPVREKDMYIYIIENTKPGVKTSTSIGAVENVPHRINQHNGSDGPRSTKKGKGNWKLRFVLHIPSFRTDISVKKIKEKMRGKSRGLRNRLERGIKYAEKYKLQWSYSIDLVTRFDFIKEHFENYANNDNIVIVKKNVEQTADEKPTEQVEPPTAQPAKRKIRINWENELTKLRNNNEKTKQTDAQKTLGDISNISSESS